MLEYAFFRNALAGLLIISIVAGIIGTYVITRRMVSITGGVTHACFGGLGLGYYLGVSPIATAALFAIVSSLGVDWLSARYRVREDSAIAVIWALGMALGILFVFLTPGYVPELNAFLFGNILTITGSDLLLFAGFALVTSAFFIIFRREVIACAFDPDFSKVAGVKVRAINSVMTVIVAVCVVLTIRLVGIMLLIALLTLPVLIAELWIRRYIPLMLCSIAITALAGVGGLLISTVVDVPCSAIIVLLLTALYLVGRLLRR